MHAPPQIGERGKRGTMTDFDDLEFNRSAYDLWSTHYDRDSNSTIAADEESFPAVWQHLVGRRVLEIGCGTGRHTQKMLALGAEVTGIDPSSGMLDVARSKVTSKSLELIHGDFLTYHGFSPGAFDAIVTSLVLEHIAELDPFFRRVADLLSAGGEFFLSEIHPDRISNGSQANFTDPKTGANTRLISHAHRASSIADAGRGSGLSLIFQKDVLGTADLAARNPVWGKYLDKPMVKIWGFKK